MSLLLRLTFSPATTPAKHSLTRLLTTTPTNDLRTPGKFEFLAVVPDHPDSLSKRLAVRADHFAALQDNVTKGKVKVGGATLEEVPAAADAPMQMNGSALVVVAGSVEEVKEFLKTDVYAQTGVWDVEKATILPFKCAFRQE